MQVPTIFKCPVKKAKHTIGRYLLHLGCSGMAIDALGKWSVLHIDHTTLSLVGATGATIAGLAAYFLEQ